MGVIAKGHTKYLPRSIRVPIGNDFVELSVAYVNKTIFRRLKYYAKSASSFDRIVLFKGTNNNDNYVFIPVKNNRIVDILMHGILLYTSNDQKVWIEKPVRAIACEINNEQFIIQKGGIFPTKLDKSIYSLDSIMIIFYNNKAFVKRISGGYFFKEIFDMINIRTIYKTVNKKRCM